MFYINISKIVIDLLTSLKTMTKANTVKSTKPKTEKKKINAKASSASSVSTRLTPEEKERKRLLKELTDLNPKPSTKPIMNRVPEGVYLLGISKGLRGYIETCMRRVCNSDDSDAEFDGDDDTENEPEMEEYNVYYLEQQGRYERSLIDDEKRVSPRTKQLEEECFSHFHFNTRDKTTPYVELETKH